MAASEGVFGGETLTLDLLCSVIEQFEKEIVIETTEVNKLCIVTLK